MTLKTLDAYQKEIIVRALQFYSQNQAETIQGHYLDPDNEPIVSESEKILDAIEPLICSFSNSKSCIILEDHESP